MGLQGCDTFTGSDGKIKINGVVVGVADFEISFTRSVIERNEVGKFTKIICPTRLDVTGRMTKAVIDGHFLAMAIGGDINKQVSATTTVITVNAIGAVDLLKLDADLTDPATPSRLKVTTSGTVASTGILTAYGTDSAGNQVVENIKIDTTVVGSFYGTQIFKTVTKMIVPGLGAAANVVVAATGGKVAATAVLAATTITDNTPQLIESGFVQPSVPARLRYTCVASADGPIQAGAKITVSGADVNSKAVSETIEVPEEVAASATKVLYGTQIFKSVESVTVGTNYGVSGVGADASIQLDTVTGTTVVTIGKPTYFSVEGRVYDESADTFIYLAAKNCFFTSSRLPIGDIDTVVDTEQEFRVVDPSADLYLGYINATG